MQMVSALFVHLLSAGLTPGAVSQSSDQFACAYLSPILSWMQIVSKVAKADPETSLSAMWYLGLEQKQRLLNTSCWLESKAMRSHSLKTLPKFLEFLQLGPGDSSSLHVKRISCPPALPR